MRMTSFCGLDDDIPQHIFPPHPPLTLLFSHFIAVAEEWLLPRTSKNHSYGRSGVDVGLDEG